MGTKEEKPARRQAGAAQHPAQPAAGHGRAERPARFTWLSNPIALGVAGLGLMVAVSYLPALWAGFIWDDIIFTEERVIRQWSGLWSIWFSPTDIKNEGHYWPIVYTSFWLEHKLWGLTPFGYHLVNVLLHFANCLLVWRLLWRLAVPGAWAVAAVFAVHPLHVESVAWVIERKDLLSALFYLSAVLVWIRFVDTGEWRRYGLALALFTAALLCKSVAVTLPAALLIWHWWQRPEVTRADLYRLIPFFVVGLGITAADYGFYTSREALALGYTVIERVLIACRALWFYVGKLLWPADLAVIYPLWDIRAGDARAWAYVVAAAAVPGLLWLARHRIGRGPLAGALFFAVTLSPTLGFVDYGYMQFAFVADRFQYLAGIGVMAVLVGGAAWGASRLAGVMRVTANGLLAATLVLLGTLTWAQAGIFRDEVTFFRHIVSLNPKARRAHTNAGRRLVKLGRFDEAEDHLRRALEVDPHDSNARQNMAEVLRRTKRYDEAIEAFRTVLRAQPESELAHGGMAMALFELKRYEEAIAAMEKALALKPDGRKAGSLHLYLGRAFQAQGRLDEADRHFRRAAAMDPGKPAPLMDLAKLRAAQERPEEALRLLRRARELASRDLASLHRIAEALRTGGHLQEAEGVYRQALRLEPDFAPAHAGLGIALFGLKQDQEAIETMLHALRLDPGLSVAGTLHLFMGRAHQSLGRTEAAAEQFERASQADPEQHRCPGPPGLGTFRTEALPGGGRALSEAAGDSPVGGAVPRQPGRHPVPSGTSRRGASELRTLSLPGPAPAGGQERCGSHARPCERRRWPTGPQFVHRTVAARWRSRSRNRPDVSPEPHNNRPSRRPATAGPKDRRGSPGCRTPSPWGWPAWA